MIALKRILVPTDFSESSAAAVRYGVAFARAFGARLDLLHVAGSEELAVILEGERVVQALTEPAGTPDQAGSDRLLHEAERQRLATLLTEEEQRELRTEYALRVSESGGPYGEIVRYAVEQEIDLIVIGSHGGGSLAHALTASVADKMVRYAPCPVLTVRLAEHEFVVPDVPVAPHPRS